MNFKIEYEQETDGRWIAEIVSEPGVMAYGNSPDEATAKVKALLFKTIADRLENDEIASDLQIVSF
ncbi:MAG: type II toxin-antitoxin system HicB family antitoxin [Candidatus Kapabacteria bacterium]|nr:type II toxin-antitoxin system HicB family antitoxin [Candidatus Kapabacteria bacterium]